MSVQVRVSDICAQDILAGATLVGVDTPTGARVAAIDLLLPDTVIDAPLTPRGAVVLALDGPSPAAQQHLIDVVVRRAHAASSAMVLVVNAAPHVPAVTKRFAESLALPLVLVPAGVSAAELVVGLRILLSSPEQPFADVVLEVAQRLARAPRRLEQIRELLESALPGANVYFCAGHELVLVGHPLITTPDEVVEHASAGIIQRDDGGAAVMPVAGVSGDTSVWLVAERAGVGRLWLDSALAALGLCGGAVLAWLAREQIALDRDARMRSTLLAELLDKGSEVSREVAEQSAQTGWQLEGWHIGLHFHFGGSPAGAITAAALARQLGGIGLTPSMLVERTDGWSAWLTSRVQPAPDYPRKLAQRIERDLRRPPEGQSLVIGIGSPQRDVAGIAATLAEARQAAVVASSSTKPVSVRVLQELGPSRLLLGWYSSDAFADYAREMLAPIIAGGEPELINTLEAYLERACSTAQTARALGVHRNTVAGRIAKAERILGGSVTAADTRLALQLALRVMRTRPTGR